MTATAISLSRVLSLDFLMSWPAPTAGRAEGVAFGGAASPQTCPRPDFDAWMLKMNGHLNALCEFQRRSKTSTRPSKSASVTKPAISYGVRPLIDPLRLVLLVPPVLRTKGIAHLVLLRCGISIRPKSVVGVETGSVLVEHKISAPSPKPDMCALMSTRP